MANDCSFEMKIVSKTKKNLDRFVKIMKYEDSEYFLYRVFEFGKLEEYKDEGYYVLTAYGTVAWGCDGWVLDKEDKTDLIHVGYEKNEKGEDDWSKPILGTAHYTNLETVCKDLQVAVEIWSEEYGMCFQQHIIVAKDGTYTYGSRKAVYVDPEDDNALDDAKDWFREQGIDPEGLPQGEEYLGGYDDLYQFQPTTTLWGVRKFPSHQ